MLPSDIGTGVKDGCQAVNALFRTAGVAVGCDLIGPMLCPGTRERVLWPQCYLLNRPYAGSGVGMWLGVL